MGLSIPRVIGHRGAADYAPENTLEGIQKAWDLGVTWVEVDVKLTKDNIPILFHDDDLDRTTNAKGKIAELTFEEVRKLNCSNGFSEQYKDVKIPSLTEAIKLIQSLGMGLNLEVKPCKGRDEETSEVVRRYMDQEWPNKEDLLISSFSSRSLEHFRLSGYNLGVLFEKDIPQNWEEQLSYFNASTININGNTCSHDAVAAFKKASLPIVAYTINETERGSTLFEWGVSSLFSDRPDIFL